eukprot:scaffold1006_cov408-Prasinococcus_capsulatus_cf.AAC.11
MDRGDAKTLAADTRMLCELEPLVLENGRWIIDDIEDGVYISVVSLVRVWNKYSPAVGYEPESWQILEDLPEYTGCNEYYDFDYVGEVPRSGWFLAWPMYLSLGTPASTSPSKDRPSHGDESRKSLYRPSHELHAPTSLRPTNGSRRVRMGLPMHFRQNDLPRSHR